MPSDRQHGRAILVVEDDRLVAGAVSRLLRRTARRPVLVAHSASEAIETLGARDDWSGLVLDVTLGRAGEPTGLDVLRFARARYSTLPIVMLTGRLEHDLVNEAARLRASYLCKPAGPADLRPFVEQVLSREAFSDARLANAVEDTLLRADLHATRPADVLRLAVAGLSPEQIREELGMTVGAYDHNVQRLLRGTTHTSLHGLVTAVVRAAMGAPGDPPE